METPEVAKLRMLELLAAEFQRPLNQGVCNKRARKFDPIAVGVLAVSARPDGSLRVFDGWQRRGLLLVVLGPDAEWNVEIFTGLTFKDEVRGFTTRNDCRVDVKRQSIYEANLQAHHPKAMAIEQVLKNTGLTLGKDIGSIQRLEGILAVGNNHGQPDLLENTLRIVRIPAKTFGEMIKVPILDIVANILLANSGNEIDYGRLRDAIVKDFAMALYVGATGSQKKEFVYNGMLKIVNNYNRDLRRVDRKIPLPSADQSQTRFTVKAEDFYNANEF